MKRIVSVGGGLASGYKVVDVLVGRYGRENVVAVTCWLPNEHPDMSGCISTSRRPTACRSGTSA